MALYRGTTVFRAAPFIAVLVLVLTACAAEDEPAAREEPPVASEVDEHGEAEPPAEPDGTEVPPAAGEPSDDGEGEDRQEGAEAGSTEGPHPSAAFDDTVEELLADLNEALDGQDVDPNELCPELSDWDRARQVVEEAGGDATAAFAAAGRPPGEGEWRWVSCALALDLEGAHVPLVRVEVGDTAPSVEGAQAHRTPGGREVQAGEVLMREHHEFEAYEDLYGIAASFDGERQSLHVSTVEGEMDLDELLALFDAAWEDLGLS